jgi:hypothetical protein
MRKKPYLCRDMRYLVVTALALLSWSWAQQYVSPRQTRVFQRNPQIEAITRNAQWVLIDLDEGLSPGSQPQRRITDFGANLGWLKPSQDADTVPTTPNTTQDGYAGDTVLANNAGNDIDPNISSDCHHTFFDSLYILGALAIRNPDNNIFYLGNYLHGDPQGDTVFYIGGGIAERYDIDPPTGSSVYIKGIAAIILNNRYSSDAIRCNPTTGEVGGGPWPSDNVYTIGYQLLDTIEVVYDVRPNRNAPPDLRVGSYPNQVVAEVTKPLTDVRIGYPVNAGQCVAQVVNRLERFDHAYFPTPVEITDDPDCKKSFYAALRFDLYVPDSDNINDTLFGVFAPYYPNATDPCLTADTNYPGRNMLLTPGFRQSTSAFIYPDEWYPQYFLFDGRGIQLNLAVCPIIYVGQTAGNCLTASTPVVRNGSMAFSAPYPNPAIDCLHLNVESPAATTLRLALYTSEGRLVRSWNRTLQSGTNTVAVDLEVPAGAYLLQAQSPYGAATFWVNVVK